MNNDMKCPFCQQELKPQTMDGKWLECWNCSYCEPNSKHLPQPILCGSRELWKELIDTKKKLDIAMDGLKRIEKLTEPSYKNRNLEALALAVNTFSGEIIEQINQRNNNE